MTNVIEREPSGRVLVPSDEVQAHLRIAVGAIRSGRRVEPAVAALGVVSVTLRGWRFLPAVVGAAAGV